MNHPFHSIHFVPFLVGFFYSLHRGRRRLPHRQSPQPEQLPLRLSHQHRRLHELLLPRPPAALSPLHHRFPISPFPRRLTTVAAIPPLLPSKAPSGSTFRALPTSPACVIASLRSLCSPPSPRSAPSASSASANASRSSSAVRPEEAARASKKQSCKAVFPTATRPSAYSFSASSISCVQSF